MTPFLAAARIPHPQLFAIGLLLLSGGSAEAQVIRGLLLDDSTNVPVAGATVVLLDEGGAVRGRSLTDTAGVFVLGAELGIHRLRAERLGYGTKLSPAFRVSDPDTLRVTFRIGGEAVRLPPLVVTATRRPGRELFSERMARGEGVHLTPEMVDSLRPEMHVGEIFRHADETWVHWTWGRYEDGRTGPIPRVKTYLGKYGCVHFIVDRTPVPAPFFESSVWGVPPLADLTPEDLVAVEVYRSWHEVPEDFRKQLRIRNHWERRALQRIDRKACGVAILWTAEGW